MPGTSVSGTSFILADSDSDNAHIVDLMAVPPAMTASGRFVLQGTFAAPPPKPEEETREVTVDVFFQGVDADALENQRREVQALLELAPMATGAEYGQWTGQPIVLRAKERASSNYVYFDVLRGVFEAKERDSRGPAPVAIWTLRLTCLPLARGDYRVLRDWTTATVAGSGTELLLQDIPGDAGFLSTVEIKDGGSTGGDVLAGGLIGARQYRFAKSGDYTAIVAATPQSPGSTNAAAGGIGGSEAQLTTSAVWQAVCRLSPPAGGLNYGLARLLLHYRVSTAIIDAPTNLSAVALPSGGVLEATLFQVMVTEIAPTSGIETVASDPVTVLVPGSANTGSIVLNWTPVGAPANYRIYVKQPYGALGSPLYYSHLTGSTATTYTITTLSGWTHPATPPSSTPSDVLPPQLRVRTALAATTPIWGIPSDPIEPVIGGNVYEYGEAGTFPLPPLPRQERNSDLPSVIQVEARSQSTATPTVGVSGGWLFPQGRGQEAVAFEYPGRQPAAGYRYVIDQRRDGRRSGLITNLAGSAVIGGFLPRGRLLLRAGNAILFVAPYTLGGRANLGGQKYQVRLSGYPLYRDVIGAVS